MYALKRFAGLGSRGVHSLRAFTSVTSESEFYLEFLNGDSKGIAVMSMNRPKYKNAISRNLLEMLDKSLQQLRFDRQVRAVILRSAAPGIFCAGTDLKERAVMKPEDVAPFVARARRVFSDFSSMPMPTLVALDGGAYGGGLEISLAADIRVAAHDAKMGLTETGLAIIPGGGALIVKFKT